VFKALNLSESWLLVMTGWGILEQTNPKL